MSGLGACTPPDAHVPPFARVPYERFSRESVVAIALREWRLFGQRAEELALSDEPAKAEREPGLWQRVGEYWWIGLDAGAPESGWTGQHDGHGVVFPPDRDGAYAWSAAFISYVMRLAGAGRRFPYAPDHADYINAARTRCCDWVVAAEPPSAYAPRRGDLICRGRGWASALRYADLPAGRFPAHCDIVVGSGPGVILTVGGNVEDAVTMRSVPVTIDGRIATADDVVLDPRNPWMVVLRLSGTNGANP